MPSGTRSRIRCEVSWRRRSAVLTAAARSVSGRTTQNSSPPSRIGTSVSRVSSEERVAEALEHAVAHVMAVTIVDTLEVIKVAHQQRDIGLRHPGGRTSHAIAHAGERIVRGEMTEPLAVLDRDQTGRRLIDEQANRTAGVLVPGRSQSTGSSITTRPLIESSRRRRALQAAVAPRRRPPAVSS